MDNCGLCTKCGEWTELEAPCCGSGVWIEGDIRYPEDDDDCA